MVAVHPFIVGRWAFDAMKPGYCTSGTWLDSTWRYHPTDLDLTLFVSQQSRRPGVDVRGPKWCNGTHHAQTELPMIPDPTDKSRRCIEPKWSYSRIARVTAQPRPLIRTIPYGLQAHRATREMRLLCVPLLALRPSTLPRQTGLRSTAKM